VTVNHIDNQLIYSLHPVLHQKSSYFGPKQTWLSMHSVLQLPAFGTLHPLTFNYTIAFQH